MSNAITPRGLADEIDPIERVTELVIEAVAEVRSRLPLQISQHPFEVKSRLGSYGQCGPSMSRLSRVEGIEESEAAYWLDVCSRLCWIGRADDFDHETRRGYTISCKLTGLGWNDVQKAVGDVRAYGLVQSARMWARFMRPFDERYVGWLYTAESDRYPGAIKIGFSTEPEKRAKKLAQNLGSPVRLRMAIPATMAHEWVLHGVIPRAVAPEWYPSEVVPSFLHMSSPGGAA